MSLELTCYNKGCGQKFVVTDNDEGKYILSSWFLACF